MWTHMYERLCVIIDHWSAVNRKTQHLCRVSLLPCNKLTLHLKYKPYVQVLSCSNRGRGLWCPFHWPQCPSQKITVWPWTYLVPFLELPICAVLKGKSRTDLCNLISEERVKIFEQNSENLMKISWKISKLWHFKKHFLDQSIWKICKWVSWCHRLTIFHSFCTYRNDKNFIFQLWEC